jgi:kynurenine formamidase
MKLIDLTGPIYTGMWQYCPQYPGARIEECALPDFAKPGAALYCQKFAIGGQTGTYIETAAHIDRSATPVAELPLADFWLDCVIIRLPDQYPSARISRDELERAAPPIRPGDAVLLRTGWDRHWRAPDFVEGSPYLSREAAEWLIDQRPALLGSDLPRFDSVRAPEFPWRRFFAEVKLLLAPVVNLDAVPVDRARLIAFPLKIEGAVSTPCRAAVLVEEQ